MGLNNEFIIGSEGNAVKKSYLAQDNNKPSNSFIYLELDDNPEGEDAGYCGFKAYIISNTTERKQLNKLYTNCDI